MTERNEHHVIFSLDGGWAVKKRQNTRASRVFDEKGDAVTYGKKMSESHCSELIIHRKDGSIEAYIPAQCGNAVQATD